MTELMPTPSREMLYAHYGQIMLQACRGCQKAPVPLCRITPHFYCPYCKMVYKVSEATVQSLFAPTARPSGCVSSDCLDDPVCPRYEPCGCVYKGMDPTHCRHCAHTKACHRA